MIKRKENTIVMKEKKDSKIDTIWRYHYISNQVIYFKFMWEKFKEDRVLPAIWRCKGFLLVGLMLLLLLLNEHRRHS